MLTTGKQARAKWCRHSRAPLASPPADGSGELIPLPGTQSNRWLATHALCLATDCMAWGWYDGPEAGEDRRGFCRAEPVAPSDVPSVVHVGAPPGADLEETRRMAAKISGDGDLIKDDVAKRADEIRRGARGPGKRFKP